MSAQTPTLNRIETSCAACGRAVVMDLEINLDDPELAEFSRDIQLLAKRLKCNRCQRPKMMAAPSRGDWLSRSVPPENTHDD